jgi:cell division septation protein DedD
MKKSTVIAVVAMGVLPFYACSNSEQSAYMDRPSIEANALEAEQAEQEFAELAAKEAAGGDTHASQKVKREVAAEKAHGKTDAKKAGKREAKKDAKPEAKAVAKHDTVKIEKKKESHPPEHTGRKVASVTQTGSSSAVWVVQLGAFRVKENAEKLTQKLKTGGYPVIMQPLNHSKNGQLYVVALEPTPNKAEAKKWQSDLKAKSYETNIVFRKD